MISFRGSFRPTRPLLAVVFAYSLFLIHGLCCPPQDPLDATSSVIVIRSLVPGGVAEHNGGLLPGDQLVFVNDVYLDASSLAQAVEVLKALTAGKVYLGIRKPLVRSGTTYTSCGNSQ